MLSPIKKQNPPFCQRRVLLFIVTVVHYIRVKFNIRFLFFFKKLLDKF